MNLYRNDYLISTDKDKLDVGYIQLFLSHSYWAEEIPVDVVKRSIEHSMCFGIYEDGGQVGFARVVTDHATFAYLADVFIDENHRGRGLSKWMMETIMDHADLQGLRTWQLATKDAHGLYEQFGFKRIENPERLMRIAKQDIYKKKQE